MTKVDRDIIDEVRSRRWEDIDIEEYKTYASCEEARKELDRIYWDKYRRAEVRAGMA